MTTYDKRLFAHRPDLADARLRGRVEATHFNEGKPAQFMRPVTGIHREPKTDAMQISQALLGETCLVFDNKDGWAWVQLDGDSYVGYVPSQRLNLKISAATHRVCVPCSHVYKNADLKSQPAVNVVLNSRLTVTAKQGDFLALASGGFIFESHVSDIGKPQKDFVAEAEKFLHTPYLWGGKSTYGIDCSGLVQVALDACGIDAPRDSDMQEEGMGTNLPLDKLDNLQRGDLIFWKGHVGIMRDPTTLLHANGHHMSTVVEPLKKAITRIAAKGSAITSIKRL